MKKYMNRSERLEIATGADGINYWLSLPPKDDVYHVMQIVPMNTPQATKDLTQAEYRRFKRELDGRIDEVRWAIEKAE